MDAEKPDPMPVMAENIPTELKTGKQFIVWRWEFIKGKWTKPLYHPQGYHAKSNDPSTWVTFGEALAAHRNGEFDGIGRCFVKDDPFTAFDLDKCRDKDGKPTPWAAAIMARLDSYTEITPSGNGFRPWVIARKPGPRSGRKNPDVEIYDCTSKRYLCLTGNTLNGQKIDSRQAETNEIYKELFEDEDPEPAPVVVNQVKPPQKIDGFFVWDGQINHLPIKLETKNAILSGFPEGSRSEPMMSVLNALVWSNLTDSQIIEIFKQYPIGDKYREKGSIRERWLQPQIDKARARVKERAEAEHRPQEQYTREPGDEPETQVESGTHKTTLTAVSLLQISSEKIETTPIAAGFVDEGENVVIHAEGGVGKSLLMMSLAVSAAAKFPLLWGQFPISRQRTALFVQSENGRKCLNERAIKMCQGTPELARGFENIFFAGREGGVELAGAVTKKSFREDIYTCVKESGLKIDIIVFDPLISYHDADENDNSRMRTTLDCISEIGARLNADPFVVHHDNRMGAIRGASAIKDWSRHVIHIFPAGYRLIEVVSEKRNNAEKFRPFVLEIDDFLNFTYREAEDALNHKLVKRCQAVKDALILQGSSVETQTALIEQYKESSGLKNESTIRNHIKEAVSYGFIFCEYYEEDGVKKCKYHI